MVPAACDGSKIMSWRHSFSLVERSLGRSLHVIVRKIYILVRLLTTFHMEKSQTKVLSAYCLKTLIFWFCERHHVSHSSEADIAGILQCVLDWVIHALVRREIQHYFIPSVNLLGQTSPKDTKAVAKTLVDIRQNLVEYISGIGQQLRFHGVGCFTDLPSMSDFKTSVKSPTDAALFRRVSTNLLANVLAAYVEHIRTNEELEDTGATGLMKQAMRLRYLRILHDLTAEMKCAECFNGFYNLYLLLRLSELLGQEAVVLAKVFVWLNAHHTHHGRMLDKMAGAVCEGSQSTDVIFGMARDIIKERGDSLVRERLTQLQNIEEYVRSDPVCGPTVQSVEITRESSMIYKQYYNLLAGRAVESLVDTDNMPTISLTGQQNAPLTGQQSIGSGPEVSPVTQLTDQLGTLLGQMSGAATGDLGSLLKQTQQMFAWVQSQQGHK